MLDAHGLIGYLRGDRRLSEKVRLLIEDPENEIFLSLVSVWEMSIKQGKGKLGLTNGVRSLIEGALQLDFRLLPIELDHVLAVQGLPHRGDRFDRLRGAQARTEGLSLLSCGPAFDALGIERAR